MKPKVLITGGSGYLGQFLVHALHEQFQVALTYSTRSLSQAPAGVNACKVDLTTGQGLPELFLDHGPFLCVINCAAVSVPAQCEKDPSGARALNIPTHLLSALQQQQQQHPSQPPLLIHISTDQVYDGSRSMWKESDVCEPVNEYGRSKLEAEQAVQAWPGTSVILRSSIIYGPQPPDPVPRSLFLQFVDGVISRKEPTTFFNDQWRCPVYVKDIIKIVQGLIQAHTVKDGLAAGSCMVLNMGGPERLNRVDMALKVASHRSLNQEEQAAVVLSVASASLTLPSTAVVNPLDISMDSTKLCQLPALEGVQLTHFADALTECLN